MMSVMQEETVGMTLAWSDCHHDTCKEILSSQHLQGETFAMTLARRGCYWDTCREAMEYVLPTCELHAKGHQSA